MLIYARSEKVILTQNRQRHVQNWLFFVSSRISFYLDLQREAKDEEVSFASRCLRSTGLKQNVLSRCHTGKCFGWKMQKSYLNFRPRQMWNRKHWKKGQRRKGKQSRWESKDVMIIFCQEIARVISFQKMFWETGDLAKTPIWGDMTPLKMTHFFWNSKTE